MCNVNEDLSVDITLPEDFSSDKEIKVYTHGFSADVSGVRTQSTTNNHFLQRISVLLEQLQTRCKII